MKVKAFVLGSLTGLAATAVSLELRIAYIKRNRSLQKPTIVDDHVLNPRADLIQWLCTAPGRGISAERIHEYYEKEAARIDAIYQNQTKF